jgi:hypothetical protein
MQSPSRPKFMPGKMLPEVAAANRADLGRLRPRGAPAKIFSSDKGWCIQQFLSLHENKAAALRARDGVIEQSVVFARHRWESCTAK